jgi:beta-1,4-mannosyltransferase
LNLVDGSGCPLPGSKGINPYIRLLVASLKRAGVNVGVSSGHRVFPLWFAIQEHGRPDVIHIQWHHKFFVSGGSAGWLRSILRTTAFFLQVFSLYLLGIRLVWTVHNIVNHEHVKERWEILCCRLLARCAHGLIVHSHSAVSIVADAYKVSPNRLHVIPLGDYGECEQYRRSTSKHEARRTLGLKAEDRVLLFFGIIRSYKGLDKLLSSSSDISTHVI